MADTAVVTSEIYGEVDYIRNLKKSDDKNVIAKFVFKYPLFDEDGDLIVQRTKDSQVPEQFIEIEHSSISSLKLVGLQVWRGALLLSDYLLHLGPEKLKNSTILELGSGVGLTSIVASKFANNVICTDVDLGNILKLISSNFLRNKHHVKSKYSILGLDFYENEFSNELKKHLQDVSIVLAADVIYDNDITDAFVNTIERLLIELPSKDIYVALEKRYVFTVSDLDSVAPCYEHFLLRLSEMMAKNMSKNWSAIQLDIDFPQYFRYERVKQFVLWKISS